MRLIDYDGTYTEEGYALRNKIRLLLRPHIEKLLEDGAGPSDLLYIIEGATTDEISLVLNNQDKRMVN